MGGCVWEREMRERQEESFSIRDGWDGWLVGYHHYLTLPTYLNFPAFFCFPLWSRKNHYIGWLEARRGKACFRTRTRTWILGIDSFRTLFWLLLLILLHSRSNNDPTSFYWCNNSCEGFFFPIDPCFLFCLRWSVLLHVCDCILAYSTLVNVSSQLSCGSAHWMERSISPPWREIPAEYIYGMVVSLVVCLHIGVLVIDSLTDDGRPNHMHWMERWMIWSS